MKKWTQTAVVSLFITVLFPLAGWAQSAINDSQIAAVVKAINDAEIDAAKIAKSKASNKIVKEFANNMIEDHKKNSKEAKQALHQADMKVESNGEAKQMKINAKNKIAALKKMKGTEFDAMYIDQQITMHQQVVSDLEEKYIPAATGPQFKEYLQKTHEHVAGHLARAKEIQETLPR